MAKKQRDISTTDEGEDDLADVTSQELENTPANRSANTEHTKADSFRQAVHQQPVTRVDEDLGIGPRDPYPVGNPPDQREIFHSINGFYPEETDAPLKTGRP